MAKAAQTTRPEFGKLWEKSLDTKNPKPQVTAVSRYADENGLNVSNKYSVQIQQATITKLVPNKSTDDLLEGFGAVKLLENTTIRTDWRKMEVYVPIAEFEANKNSIKTISDRLAEKGVPEASIVDLDGVKCYKIEPEHAAAIISSKIASVETRIAEILSNEPILTADNEKEIQYYGKTRMQLLEREAEKQVVRNPDTRIVTPCPVLQEKELTGVYYRKCVWVSAQTPDQDLRGTSPVYVTPAINQELNKALAGKNKNVKQVASVEEDLSFLN